MALHLIFYDCALQDFADQCVENYCKLNRTKDITLLYNLCAYDNIDAIILPLTIEIYDDVHAIINNIQQRAHILTPPIILLIDDIRYYDNDKINALSVDDILYYHDDFAINIARLQHIKKYHINTYQYFLDNNVNIKVIDDDAQKQYKILLLSDDVGIKNHVNMICQQYNIHFTENINHSPSIVIADCQQDNIYQTIYDIQQQYDQQDIIYLMINENIDNDNIIIGNLNIDKVILRERYLHFLKPNILFFIKYLYHCDIIKHYIECYYNDSMRDPLTNLYNRRFLDQYMQQQNDIVPYIIMMIDIDDFKSVNDQEGYNGGDELLKSLAKFLLLNLREQDIIARYGGDEFIVICPNTPSDIGKILTTRLLQQSFISISIGYICADGNKQNNDVILKMIDNALKDAKSLGKNCAIEYKSE